MALPQPYYPDGATEFRSTAAKITGGPDTTQQIGADNSDVENMRAATGTFQQDAPDA